MGAYATVTAIRVQDLYRSIWFKWDNGTWDALPAIEAWGSCYIAVWATNPSPATRNMTLKLIEGGATLMQKVESVPAGAGFGIEWTGAFVPPAARNIKIEVWIDHWVETTKTFDLGVYTEPPVVVPPVVPPVVPSCMLTAIGAPLLLLGFLRTNIRPRCPAWFVKLYYKVNLHILSIFF